MNTLEFIRNAAIRKASGLFLEGLIKFSGRRHGIQYDVSGLNQLVKTHWGSRRPVDIIAHNHAFGMAFVRCQGGVGYKKFSPASIELLTKT